MKILFLGTKGIPNSHGGYERFVEKLAPYLAANGINTFVTCPHYQEYKESTFESVCLKFVFDPEKKLGALGNLIYDFLSIIYAISNRFDIIYMCAYTSAILLWIIRLFSSKSILVTNMDGLEWKRSKWSKPVQKYLKFCEKLAVKSSHHCIADGTGIESYLSKEFPEAASKLEVIEYGTEYPVTVFDESILEELKLVRGKYCVVVARIEPENNLEMIIEGYLKSSLNGVYPMVIVGPMKTPHAEYLNEKYGGESSIRFVGGIYDETKLFTIRKYAAVNLHGHSVGGTNPSLLEALSVGTLVVVHDNIFNRGVVGEQGTYFRSAGDLAKIFSFVKEQRFDNSNYYVKQIEELFTWEIIDKKYLLWFKSISKHNANEA
ncbi:DUF1972 domain-containing protein [Candidatus Dojkabacteria bacterium]|nr:DUF1972 domain-containing protein [Candidatus Dojkabacteria bacterium]